MYRWKFQPRGYVKYTNTTYRWFIYENGIYFFFILFVFLFPALERVGKKRRFLKNKKNAIYLGTHAITAGKITMIYRIIAFLQGGTWFTVSAISAYLRRSRYFVIDEPWNKIGWGQGLEITIHAYHITDYCIFNQLRKKCWKYRSWLICTRCVTHSTKNKSMWHPSGQKFLFNSQISIKPLEILVN